MSHDYQMEKTKPKSLRSEEGETSIMAEAAGGHLFLLSGYYGDHPGITITLPVLGPYYLPVLFFLPQKLCHPVCLSFFPIFTVNLSPSLWSNTTSSKVSIRNYSTIFLEFRVCPGSVLGPGEVVAGKKKKPHQRRTFERRGNDKDRDSGNENSRCKVSEGRISRTFKVSVDGV